LRWFKTRLGWVKTAKCANVISYAIEDRHIVTMEGQQEVTYALSIGMNFDDLE